MSYLVTVAFDIDNAEPQDYPCLNELLDKQGLKRTLKSDKGKDAKLPSNTYAAVVEGAGTKEIRESYADQINKAFEACGISGKFLVTVGDLWGWHIKTKTPKNRD